jgi:ParB-like nuclease family protein
MSRIEARSAIFPMMSADDLADLAADIKANGQRFPIIVGPYEGREVIVDGRNRYEACEIAGVDPKFEKLNGHDPKAFILSMNVKRRHMTSAQRTMAVAMIYPAPSRNVHVPSPAKELADDGALSKARTVLRHSRSLAEAILAGSQSLLDAYDEVRRAEGKISNETIRLRDLCSNRPDLAESVVQGEITLDEATAQAKREAEAVKQRRWAATKNLVEGVQLLDRSIDTASDLLNEYDPHVAQQIGETITPERLARVAQFATALAHHMEERTAS